MNSSRLRRVIVGVSAVLVLSAVMVQSASARTAYVAGYYDDVVYVLDAASGHQVAPPIPTGSESGPYTLAISPDGQTVWVLNYKSGTLISIQTATNQIVGTPITVPKQSYNIAITPDGSRAYLANYDEDAVVGVDLQARQVIGAPVPTDEGADGVSITPDGTRVYVSNNTNGTVSVVDIATNQVIGAPILVGGRPYYSAITPDGRTLLVADQDGTVRVLDIPTGTVQPAINVGEDPSGLAISPDGKRAYTANYDSDDVSVIELATRQALPQTIPTPEEPEFIAFTPDGTRALVSSWTPAQIFPVDTSSLQLAGLPTSIGEGSGTVAVVPDQSPTASITKPAKVRPGVPVTLDASASSDPDGAVTGFAWNFGDGQTASLGTPTASHKYAKPGTYTAILTVTDNEGCSVGLVFTGQTASCHGNAAATVTQKVKVAYPGVKVRCPASADGPCRFKVKAVAKKKGKLKAQSKVARAKAKPGKSAIVSLKPKKAFAKKLAKAKKVLVQEVVTADGETTNKLKRLKVVR